jgi:DNA modification methylase
MIQLLHGDCLDLMKDIPDNSIDMILCDLPYGTTACKWDVVIPFEPLWKEYKRIIKDRGCIALFGSEPFSSHLRMSNIKDYKYDWIWEKERPTNIFNMKYEAARVHEIISVFGCGKYYPIMEDSCQPNNNNKNKNKSQSGVMNVIDTISCKSKISDNYNPALRYPRSVIKISRKTRGNKKLHPTQKPVALLEYLIKTYTLENETVLDNCMGSGSTGVACVNTNRNFIGIEKDDKYFEISQNRINKLF